MTYQIFQLPKQSLIGGAAIKPSFKVNFFLTGTTTPTPVYTTSALSVAHTQPVQADSGGVLATVYLDPSIVYKASVYDQNDVLQYTVDPVNDSLLSAAAIGVLLYPRTAAEISAGVTPTNYAYPPGDVRRYGYIADDSTDNSTALASALSQMASGGASVILPEGIARFSTSLNIPSHGVIRGAGKERTTLKYTGSAQAFKQATPSSRIYEIHLSDFSLYDIGTGTVGLDLESVSTSNFERMWIDGFTTGVRIHSPTSGYAVYNRFHDVTTNSGATTKGFVLSGTSSNAHTFIACRANFSSATATYGWEITDSNGNQIIACHPEGGLTAVHITATGAGFAGGNIVAFNRFEAFTNGVNIASANVEHTRVIENHYTIVTNPVLDSGTRSVIDDPVSALMTRTFPSTLASSANGTMRFVRDASGGASLPHVVFRDSDSGAGTPVTVQAETERSAGSYFRGKRGGNVLFDVVADNTFFIQTLTVSTLPAAGGKSYFRAMVNDANATTFHSVVAGGGANVVPVFSDGTNWRIG